MRTDKKVVEEKAYQSFWEKVKINLLVCNKCGHVVEDSFEFKLKQGEEIET